jgi:hypothetical protein
MGEIDRLKPTAEPGLGALQAACLVTAALLLLLGLARAVSAHPDHAAIDALRGGLTDLRAGDYRHGLIKLDSAIQAQPHSQYALSAKACLLWALGYQDNAVAVLQAATEDGMEWGRPLYRPCFATHAEDHGLAVVHVDAVYAIYAQPSSPRSRRFFALAQRYVRDGPASLAMLALACLNDAEGLGLIASTDLGLALNDARLGHQTGLLHDCLERQFAHRYVFAGDAAGFERYAPKDLKQRLFDPKNSPIPSVHRRVLP